MNRLKKYIYLLIAGAIILSSSGFVDLLSSDFVFSEICNSINELEIEKDAEDEDKIDFFDDHFSNVITSKSNTFIHCQLIFADDIVLPHTTPPPELKS